MKEIEQRHIEALVTHAYDDLMNMRLLQGNIAGLRTAMEMLADMRKRYNEDADDDRNED
jgi:hypothetical protein